MTRWCCVGDKRQKAKGIGAESTPIPNPKSKIQNPFLWLTLALSLFAVAPFAQPGYFWGANDARHHVYFLFEFNRVFADGMWWPRWSPDFAFGYGYPFFNIYGPLSHFLAEGLLLSGFSYTGAIETVFGLSVVASAAAMFLFVKDWIGDRAGLIAALVYTYAPYHLLVLYVRGNLAESMAFVWLPLCLWSFRRAVLGQRGWRPAWGWVMGAAASYAGLMLTSNLVIVLFTPLLAAYILLLMVQKSSKKSDFFQKSDFWAIPRSALSPILAGLWGLGLSAIFWIPMLLERNYVRVDQWFDGRYDFRDDFLSFFQLFSPRWGFGVSQAGPGDPIGFQIGVMPTVLAILGLLLVWRMRHRLRWEAALLALAGCVAAFLGLQMAAPLWEMPIIGGILQSAQFPWRWLPITVVAVSLLAGLVMAEGDDQDQRRLSRPGQFPVVSPVLSAKRIEVKPERVDLPTLLLAALILLGSYPMLRVEISEPAEGPVGLAALMRFERDADELTGSTAWVKEIPTWSPMAEYYIRQDEAGEPALPVTTKVDMSNVDYATLTLGSVAHNTIMEEVYFCTDLDPAAKQCAPRDDQRIVFNHFYYPGWRAFLLDGLHGEKVRELPIVPEESGTLGRMTVPIPATGDGFILLEYGTTTPRTVGLWVSVISLGLLILGKIGRLWKRSSR